MEEKKTLKRRGNRGVGGWVKILVRVVWITARYCKEKIASDATLFVAHIRVFVGTLLIVFGLLSFRSDRYCEGNTSSYYACTNPSTYYYYPFWTIVCVMAGVFLVTLWFLRKET